MSLKVVIKLKLVQMHYPVSN